jgi:3-oxoacyl-[acyl-carrier protein] reductase
MDITNKTLVISGAAGSLGNAMINHFSSRAKTIIAIDKDQEKLSELENAIANLAVFECNLSDYQQVKQLVNKLSIEYDVDILLNNAGIIHSEPMINLLNKERPHHDPKTWISTVESNLYSTFYLSSLIAESMIKKRTKGVIINISSIAAQGHIGQSAYAAAKAGIEALTKTWSKELAIFGLRTACIAPGFIESKSTKQALSEQKIKDLTNIIPRRRLGDIDEISNAIEFVINNDYYNGDILHLDGGLTL